MGSPELASHQDLTYAAGETATFSLGVPQGSNFSNLVWRSSATGSKVVIADWEPGDALEIMSKEHAGRLIFHKENWTLELHNLTTADGGSYEVVELGDPSDRLLRKYTLAVFKISTAASRSANGSCSLSLRCEAGFGAKTKVDYSWGPRDPGSTLDLHLHPADKDKPYTCTATARGAQRTFTITPYQACSSATRAAGLLRPALLALLQLLLLPVLL